MATDEATDELAELLTEVADEGTRFIPDALQDKLRAFFRAQNVGDAVAAARSTGGTSNIRNRMGQAAIRNAHDLAILTIRPQDRAVSMVNWLAVAFAGTDPARVAPNGPVAIAQASETDAPVRIVAVVEDRPTDTSTFVAGRYGLTPRSVEREAIDLSALADELHLGLKWLEEVVKLLEDKKQVIFYGPPGTGKTFVARQLAAYFAPDEAYRRTLQFHPSYTYEDFIAGYRPGYDDDDKQLFYELVDGPLKELAASAVEDPDQRFVMVIDEINRGNVAKIFGELYYLLEYRNDEIRLQYGGAPFVMPDNLLLIGTMNTADRSIGLLDAALRRRFLFVEFHPDIPPVKGLLRRWLHDKHPAMEGIANIVELANQKLDRNLQIGPSYFMREKLDEDWLRLIWKHSVLPYIEEQYYDEPQRVAQFELDVLLTELHSQGGESEAPDLDGVDPDGDDENPDAADA